MDVYDSAGSIDSNKLIEYITKTFPGELKSLLDTKAELAKRQGALTAVNEALADREAAAKELAAAREQAKTLLDEAKAKNAKSTARAAELNAREADLKAQETAAAGLLSIREKEVTSREQLLAIREESVSALGIKNEERQKQLDVAEAALAARIKAFQEKVAALSV
jgi:DNA repair exonuclease SbcCD ATPase subunit